MKFIKKVKYIIFAVLFCFTVFLIMHFLSNRLTTIKIISENDYVKKKIAAELEENGICKGIYIPSIDFDNLENTICFSVNEIDKVRINRKGSCITIDTTEVRKKPTIANTENPCNIIANYDMKIISASVYKGKLFAPVGSTIRKGDIIISGKYSLPKSGNTILRHADGYIKAEFEKEVTFTQKKTESSTTYSGKNFNKRNLEFFSLNIPLTLNKNAYGNYKLDATKKSLTLWGTTLPVSVDTYVYKEKIPCLSIYSDEYASELLEKQRKIFEDNILSEYEIIDSKSEIINDKDAITEKVTYKLCGKVGVRQDILVCDFAE